MSKRNCPDHALTLVGVPRLQGRTWVMSKAAEDNLKSALSLYDAEDARKEAEEVLKEAEEPSLKLRAVSLAPPALTVTTNSVGLEMGLDTLVGSYAETGRNHGKKFYQKTSGIL